MSVKIDLDALKRIGFAMTLDVCTLIVQIILFIPNFPGWSPVYSYISWLARAIRIICRLRILVLLLRLKGLNGSYRRAWGFCLVHLVLYALSSAMYVLPTAGTDYTDRAVVMPYLILAAIIIVESMFYAAGDSAALRGTAEVIKSFGLTDGARKNRHVGAMRIISASLTSILSGAVLVVFFTYLRTTDGLDPGPAEIYSSCEKRYILILLILTVCTGVINMVYCLMAADRIRRSHKEITALTKNI